MEIKKCTVEDVPQLAVLNKQLIEDEQSDNPMTIKELAERMKGFLNTEYDAYYFVESEEVIGYALVKHTCTPLYLRQFLIDRKHREKHYGTEAFRGLLEYLDTESMDIEVLPWNERGLRFWESCGFREISRYMRLEKAVEKLCKDSLCIGVDGCRGGWIVAVIERGELQVQKFLKIEDIVENFEKFDEFIIDMVIGLPSDSSHVRPDTLARTLIPGRTSTIFAVPSRQAVYADSEAEQTQKNEEVLGKGLAKQTMAIIPKMRELDSFLNCETKYKNVIKESHPEVCFARLNRAVVMSKKSDGEGRRERIQILNRFLPGLTEQYVLKLAKQYDCNADDIVDAICLAVTGNLNLQGRGETIPKNPMADEKGILMQMVIPKI